jgi:DnaJ family protein C protein 7
LTDADKKRQYDLGVDPNDPTSGFSGGDFSGGMNVDPNEIFKMFFGQGGPGAGSGHDDIFSSFGGSGGGFPGMSGGAHGMQGGMGDFASMF